METCRDVTILWLRNRVLFPVESFANRNSSYGFCTAMNKHLVNLTKQISAYAKKGDMGHARVLFDEMGHRDTVSWNVMIKSYIENNRLDDARELFDEMPERTSYSWNSMITGYKKDSKLYAALKLFITVMPEKGVVSWTSIITGMCRVSRVDEAWWLFKQMPEANSVSWSSIVSGFQQNGFPEKSLHAFKEIIYGNLDLGIYAADQILKLDLPYNSSAWLMVIDMHSLAGKWKEVAEMRRHMQRERESKKELGSSFIDVKGKIHLFTTGDDSHPQTDCIYPVIDLLSYEAVECFNICDGNFS
ncbi:PREDICTED: pentatricopeptide repeat-containing protein At1g09410-like [Ipomoea nil]|uniref:pentatricopeptide repeat-containing protein At1g09410-like n=1 Tax=Ipomoea nil TaxID=35883 RepID=UPI0009017EDB|nr:PREDICTED: pentatricopeptide repeat-containing protein At1g09410-like [Ipomoea nil]